MDGPAQGGENAPGSNGRVRIDESIGSFLGHREPLLVPVVDLLTLKVKRPSQGSGV